ncbi:Peptidoglycan/LPS O-acetylase OafA/YrhL, contains acyltransferase and SGNH-hydrolase domains [Bosea sp. CRIB-10]|uniref:acyltransferase family protein n=1 Tax=Bosea sp. CRIB-10 TaxID=378404 RepID=UPI0008E72D80|nr:acyltransferase [Bosea sp. CRIB-10]SFD34295.1 Peptidoglycan/LPS O-acetylase OafA/YrhL, contains acyltransferase and SGNH-hydrolase domains [Bosea sp. CRIB-10]
MTGFLRAASAADGLGLPHNHFGLLRLLLALAVVVSHALSVTTGKVEDELLAHSTGFTLGEHAVNGFFAISGFLVTMSYEQRGWRDYVVARTLRIAPGLIAATLVVALLMGGALTKLSLSAYLTDPQLWRFINGTLTSFKSSAPLPGVFSDNPLRFPMGTVWTLKYETLCYLGVLVAGLVGLLVHRRLVLGLWAALVVATVLREILTPDGPKGIETALRLPLIFLTGGLIYLWREKVPLSLPGLAVALVVVALSQATPAYKALLYLVTAWGVLVLALAPPLTRWRSEPRADLSYGVYLYGWPVQQAFVALFPTVGALTLFAPSLIVTLLVAAASWYLVEKPALGLKRRLLKPA